MIGPMMGQMMRAQKEQTEADKKVMERIKGHRKTTEFIGLHC